MTATEQINRDSSTLITAIIPCYNAEQFLATAIESALKQSLKPHEVIIVDDCSTDRSLEIANQYPVKILQTRSNCGHATARNLGIHSAKGDVIAWLDADDYWDSNHLETVLKLFSDFPSAGVAYSGVRFFGSRSRTWNEFPCNNSAKDVFAYCARDTIVPAMSVLTSRNILEQAGGFDENIRYAPDFDLWLRLSLITPFVATSEVTSNYRWHNNQISTNNYFEQLRTVFRSRHTLANKLRNGGDIAHAELLENVSTEQFSERLWNAWKKDDIETLKAFLSYSEFVPDSKAITNQYSLKAAMPTIVRQTWKKLSSLKKKAVSWGKATRAIDNN